MLSRIGTFVLMVFVGCALVTSPSVSYAQGPGTPPDRLTKAMEYYSGANSNRVPGGTFPDVLEEYWTETFGRAGEGSSPTRIFTTTTETVETVTRPPDYPDHSYGHPCTSISLIERIVCEASLNDGEDDANFVNKIADIREELFTPLMPPEQEVDVPDLISSTDYTGASTGPIVEGLDPSIRDQIIQLRGWDLQHPPEPWYQFQ